MSPEAQRIAIAEACGIEVIRTAPRAGGGRTRGAHVFQLPDYLNDLNAMHEAEKVLNKREQDVYARYLGELTGGQSTDRGANMIYCTTKVVFSTAAQRAEAFLKTLGLWTD